MTKNATYCDKHVSSWKCIFFVVDGDHDGDGLDEIYHVIELVLLGFDP